ncbi:YihY/virulence factor BrkB family protein [Halocatena marina]|uniref:YihY/virulence factor BrkB family protein n=1 Tax=Halocatena marina TaxID=2934937 RepID=UPI00200E75F7|nr:YihY/virulence factor BrkB family protein [Halocatena marina]
MNASVQRIISVIQTVIDGIRSEQVTFIAASLSYYAFISLIPLLLLTIVVGSVVGGEMFSTAVSEPVTNAVGGQAGELVQNALDNQSGQSGATVVSILVLLWSGLKLFRGLDVAFSTVYGEPPSDGIVGQLRNGLLTLMAVGIGIALTVAIGTIIAFPGVDFVVGTVDVIGTIGTIAQLCGLTLTLLPLYYVLPGESISVREAFPGAAFTAIGWTALQTAFRIYAAYAGSYDAYGAIGGVLLLVTFLYFGALILLVGVVLNAALTGRLDEDDPDESDAETTTVGPPIPKLSMPDDEPFDVESDDDLEAEVRRLREQLREFEEDIDDRTVHRDELESDLKRYVRRRARRGKARGWGPYLVLLYGTAMTIGAFFYLAGLWAILAMIIIWLSTLGLYVFMIVVGVGFNLLGIPARLRNRIESIRS